MHDRLGVIDASMLALESDVAPLHSGAVSIFGPGVDFSVVHDTLAARLPRIPRARQRVWSPPLGGRPVWIDDRGFDLSYHLRHAALPAPGSPEQLGDFVARLIARPLDRARPLWELYVIEGLEGGHTALFHKVHLALAGEAVDPLAAMLDDELAAPRPERPRIDWVPEPPPSAVELAVSAAREQTTAAVAVGRRLAHHASRPARGLTAAAGAAASVLGLAARVARPAPSSPLNRPLTAHRRFASARLDLDELRSVRAAFGGSVNDIVVTVVGDAVGRLLRGRGHETKDLDLSVMVPVRVEESSAAGEDLPGAHTLGEGAVGVLAPLPVMPLDPVARLYRVMGELAHLRDSSHPVAADRLARLAGFGPARLHALAARLVTGEQRYNLALSNAPGPQSPRWLAGVPLEGSYPFIPLAGDAGLSVAVSSYAGALHVGLLGDRRALADLCELPGHLHRAVADLVAAAESQGTAADGGARGASGPSGPAGG